jgi:hypothetical protein
MQQRLAVASVLVLALLAGASAYMIVAHASGQTATNTSAQSKANHDSSNTMTSGTNSTNASNGGSLLTNGTHNMSGSDDGAETEQETETGGTTSTTDP